MDTKSRRQLLLAFILVLFGTFLGMSATSPHIVQFNTATSQMIQRLQPAWFVSINQIVSAFDYLILPILLPVAYYFYQHKRYPELAIICISWLSWIIDRYLKQIFMVACPAPPLVQPLTPSVYFRDQSSLYLSLIKAFSLPVCYPSGHVFDYLSVWGTLYFLRSRLPFHRIPHIGTFLVALIVLVGISRVSLGAHWLTDVVGGYIFGLAWLLFLQYLYYQFQQASSSRKE